MLTIQNLNKRFGRKTVLENLNYAFAPSVYGLLGPNGAGKTTLLRCITRIYPVPKETIRYQGVCIRKDAGFLTRVGYLPQQFGLFRELTVYDALGLLASLKDIDRKAARPMIEECVELVHLTDVLHRRVGTLSGGMIRRLGIAQALLGDPEILIFDEPTAGLDPEERLRFQNILATVKQGRILLLSTHIVEDVEAACDVVAVMNHGHIVFSGACAEIRQRAQGKVYQLPESDREAIRGEYVVQKQYEEDGRRMLKILTDVPQDLPKAEPTIEDGYICVLKDI